MKQNLGVLMRMMYVQEPVLYATPVNRLNNVSMEELIGKMFQLVIPKSIVKCVKNCKE